MKKIAVSVLFIILVFGLGAQGTVESQASEIPAGVQERMVEPDSAAAPDLDDPLGREVARYGEERILEGTLHYIGGEWYLESGGIRYEMHMGPAGHDSPDLFDEGSSASVRGFFYRDHIAPILIDSTTGQVRFWDEGRFPIWAGRGDLMQRVTVQGERGIEQPYQQRVTVQGERGAPVPLQQNMMQQNTQ